MASRSRREFLKLAGAVAAAGSLPFPALHAGPEPEKTAAPAVPFTFGIASYTFRAFTLDQAISMTKRLGLSKLTLKDMHLPLSSSVTDIASALEKIKNAGLELSSCGVVYMKSEEEIRRAFTFAKMAGLKMLVGVPDPSLLPNAERAVKETDIALAIHNHGPKDERYPGPESAYTLIAGMDKRVGLCIDMGHTQRMGLDPSVELERFFPRVLDIHLKDVSAAEAGGETVEIGRGVIDIAKFLRTLIKNGYAGTLHYEFEKDEKDPLPGLAESVGYVRGVLAALSQAR